MVNNISMQDYIELINRVKNGDEKAFEEILKDQKKMIYKLIYTQNLDSGDFVVDADSLFQEGSLALYNCIFSYEAEKGMSFTSYAYMVVRARISTCIRKNKRKMEDCSSIDNFENLDYHLALSTMNVNDNPVQYHYEQVFEKRLNTFVSHLKEEDQIILQMRIDNMSYKDISKRLKINTKRVDNRLNILKKRLKAYLDSREEYDNIKEN